MTYGMLDVNLNGFQLINVILFELLVQIISNIKYCMLNENDNKWI